MSTVSDALLCMLGCFALSGLIIWLWGGHVARAWVREEMRESMSTDPKPRREMGTGPRIWFYKPRLWWHGLSTLSPVHRGHDEHHRFTTVLGWTITGQMVIADGRRHDCPAEDDSVA